MVHTIAVAAALVWLAPRAADIGWVVLCAVAGESSAAGRTRSFHDRVPDEARVERVLQSLTLREKVGQLLLAYPQVGK